MLWKDYKKQFPNSNMDYTEFLHEGISFNERVLRLIQRRESLDNDYIKYGASEEFIKDNVEYYIVAIKKGYPKDVIPQLVMHNQELIDTAIQHLGMETVFYLNLKKGIQNYMLNTNVSEEEFYKWLFLNEDCLLEKSEEIIEKHQEYLNNNAIHTALIGENPYFKGYEIQPSHLELFLMNKNLTEENYNSIARHPAANKINEDINHKYDLQYRLMNHDFAGPSSVIKLFHSKYKIDNERKVELIKLLVNKFNLSTPLIINSITSMVLSDEISRNWSIKDEYKELVEKIELDLSNSSEYQKDMQESTIETINCTDLYQDFKEPEL